MLVGEQVREKIAAHRFLCSEGLMLRTTASVGIATLPDAATSVEGLIRAADQGDVSRQGTRQERYRNRVIGVAARMSLRSLFSLFSSDLAIDLGTANTCVCTRGKGIVVGRPSIVAINKVNGRLAGERWRCDAEDARPHAGQHRGDQTDEGQRHRGLRSHREDADLFHQEGA